MSAATGSTGALLGAVRAILRPLVRQLIAHGVTYPAFSRLVKEVYIEVGTRHFTLNFKKQTDSRVALVTGITRKEIGQIRRGQAPRPTAAARPRHALAARVVARWLAGAPYADADGTAFLLPYEGGEDMASFVALVQEIGGDIPPRAVLDELLRVGAAKLTPRGDVYLTEAAAVPADGADEQLAILGADAADLIDAIVHNIEQPRPEAFLQRTLRHDHLAAAALPGLRARVRELGAAFAQQVTQLLGGADRERHPESRGAARQRAVVAVYYFDAPAIDDGDDGGPEPGDGKPE